MRDLDTYLTDLSKSLIIGSDKKNKIDSSILSLTKTLWGHFQERLHEVIVFGSYSRGTFISQDKNSDIDILVVFKKKELKPDTYLKQIKHFCVDYYSRSEIYQDHPTIAIDMDLIRFEIVPSYYYSNDIKKIPSPQSKEFLWINTNPIKLSNDLELKDRNHKMMIKPIIRIIKYWNYLNEKSFASFDIEKLIIEKSYSYTSFKSYYYYLTSVIIDSARSENQKKICSTLKEHNKRLKVLEQNNIPEYIESELGLFLPFPKK
ncbi:MAG: nucleotidyltransferase domain-containing protein [Bacteroidales bacterium]|nr:nucleotidyltransferase domain-containing protein [Bacteroidales bacterium]